MIRNEHDQLTDNEIDLLKLGSATSEIQSKAARQILLMKARILAILNICLAVKEMRNWPEEDLPIHK
jgi:hypothetical protein